ncbi:hypothetical protein [Enterococcus sp. AZ109]|uniref:hypothetical protein n=1 Tax=Enterococcus sp. AZ109 TaxID=2774634 RepID=UPI003F265034
MVKRITKIMVTLKNPQGKTKSLLLHHPYARIGLTQSSLALIELFQELTISREENYRLIKLDSFTQCFDAYEHSVFEDYIKPKNI